MAIIALIHLPIRKYSPSLSQHRPHHSYTCILLQISRIAPTLHARQLLNHNPHARFSMQFKLTPTTLNQLIHLIFSFSRFISFSLLTIDLVLMGHLSFSAYRDGMYHIPPLTESPACRAHGGMFSER